MMDGYPFMNSTSKQKETNEKLSALQIDQGVGNELTHRGIDGLRAGAYTA